MNCNGQNLKYHGFAAAGFYSKIIIYKLFGSSLMFCITFIKFQEVTLDLMKRADRPILKQFIELTLQDFYKYPVWVQCHVMDYEESWYDETDEETFRPWLGELPVSPSIAMFLVKSGFTFADGTKYEGFITPGEPGSSASIRELGYIQPRVFAGNGKGISFWFGALPDNYVEQEKKLSYSLIGKTPEEIFPIEFEAEEKLSEGVVKGTVPGFCRYSDDGQVIVER